MALPDDYMPALERLAKVFEESHRRTGGHPGSWSVGGQR